MEPEGYIEPERSVVANIRRALSVSPDDYTAEDLLAVWHDFHIADKEQTDAEPR